MQSQRGTINIFGYPISNRGLVGDVELALDVISRRVNSSRFFMACANPHSLVAASKDEVFQAALSQADLLVPDGSGIVIAAKILGLPLRQKVAGYDFFYALTKRLNENGGAKYFFLGSTEYVLLRIVSRLSKEFPSINVAGTFSPPFKASFSEAENHSMVMMVNETKPDVLWVGMTAPKQEKWVLTNHSKLRVPFIAAVGAVFDFYAGTKERSSEFWIKLGLEWLPRFLKEPRRLWERNLKSTPIFLWWILREKIKQIGSYPAK